MGGGVGESGLVGVDGGVRFFLAAIVFRETFKMFDGFLRSPAGGKSFLSLGGMTTFAQPFDTLAKGLC